MPRPLEIQGGVHPGANNENGNKIAIIRKAQRAAVRSGVHRKQHTRSCATVKIHANLVPCVHNGTRNKKWTPTWYWMDKIPALYRSVMIQAVQDLQRPPRGSEKAALVAARETARTWFLDWECDGVFSFATVCLVLGLTPKAVLASMSPWLCPALTPPEYDHKATVRVLCR